MTKIFTLFLGVLIAATSFAQRPEGTIMQVGENVPVIDGVLDENGAWDEAIVYNIDKNYREEVPTWGEEGETNWRALWNEDGFYLFVTTVDDDWYPSYAAGSESSWEYDKPEVYFDVNYVLDDGLGASSNAGHYQVAPAAEEAKINGTATAEDNGVVYAYMVEDPNWSVEYFVPWSHLLTGDGGPFDKTAPMGFDVTMIDRDEGDEARRRSVWANVGEVDESWSNMNDVGYVYLDGAEPGIPVDEITLTGGSITGDNDTLKIMAEILPEDASDKSLRWIVTTPDGGTPRASISRMGVITPIVNETLVVQAVSSDGFIYSNEVTVEITGQVSTMNELSFIKNGDFNDYDMETGAPGAPWTGGSTVSDGVLMIDNTNGAGENPWDWTVGQDINIPEEYKDEPFLLNIKLWAAEPRIFDIDFELIGGDYLRFGTTTDPKSSDGRSQWRWEELPTEPTTFEIEITDFSGMDDRTQKFNLFAGMATPTVYVDSVFLLRKADLALLPTGTSTRELSSFDVYPNPVQDVLNIRLTSTNTRVAIYNNMGVRIEETIVEGNQHTFDVSGYKSGMYFIQANGAVRKFVK